MLRFTFLHITVPYFDLGITNELTPACQSLFMALAHIFNKHYFPDELRISSRDLADLSGLSYSNISAIRKMLLDYKYGGDGGERLFSCEEVEKGKEPLYKLNKSLFTRLYKQLKDQEKQQIDNLVSASKDFETSLENETYHSENDSIRSENDTIHPENDTIHSKNDSIRSENETYHSKNDTIHSENDTIHSENDSVGEIHSENDSTRAKPSENKGFAGSLTGSDDDVYINKLDPNINIRNTNTNISKIQGAIGKKYNVANLPSYSSINALLSGHSVQTVLDAIKRLPVQLNEGYNANTIANVVDLWCKNPDWGNGNKTRASPKKKRRNPNILGAKWIEDMEKETEEGGEDT